MKAVLISIQPKWCELIASGEKTIEVRKIRPKLETPFKVYIYCTKGKPTFEQSAFCDEISNGKVIGEFVFDRIDEYDYDQAFDESMGVFLDSFGYSIMSGELEQTCLSYEEFEKYGNTNRLYGWHISAIKIYDKPKGLGEFRLLCSREQCARWCKDMKLNKVRVWECDNKDKRFITRPPQSWCYVEARE